MAICEKCGTRYAPTAQAPDCPQCAVGGAQPTAPKPSAAAAARPRPAAPAPAPRPATASTATAARRPARTPEPEKAPAHHEVHHLSPAEKTGFDKVTKIGMMAAGVLAVITLIVVFVVKGKKDRIAAELKAWQDNVAEIKKKIETAVAGTDDAAIEAAIAEVERTKATVWEKHPDAGQIGQSVTRGKAFLAANAERRKTQEQFKQVDERLKTPDTLSAEQIKELRVTLDTLQGKTVTDLEAGARVAKLRQETDKLYAQRVLDEIGKALAAGENLRLLLVRAQAAEDDIRTILDDAVRNKVEDLKNYYTGLYKQAIKLSDQVVTQLFTPAEIEKLPWIDCLSGTQAARWRPGTAKGFSHRIDKGVLQIVGPDPDAGKLAVLSIGDTEKPLWRNVVVDIEFTVEKEGFDMYFRLRERVDGDKVQMRGLRESDGVTLGHTYRGRFSVIGSALTSNFGDDIDSASLTKAEEISWVKSRQGAVGLVIPPGARLKVSRFQVKDLR